LCGCVVVRLCGCVGVRLCGCVVVWLWRGCAFYQHPILAVAESCAVHVLSTLCTILCRTHFIYAGSKSCVVRTLSILAQNLVSYVFYL